MLALIQIIIAKSDEVAEIHLSISAFYQLLTELPELPEATGRIELDGMPIIMKTKIKHRKILLVLKTKQSL